MTDVTTTVLVAVQSHEDAATVVSALFAEISELEARVTAFSAPIATVELTGSRNAVELALWRWHCSDDLEQESGMLISETISEQIEQGLVVDHPVDH